MNRPNKRIIAEAIFVTSYGYPAAYFLHICNNVGCAKPPTFDYLELDGVEVGSLAAGNALVRAMREHVYKTWMKHYADHKAALRIAAAKARK